MKLILLCWIITTSVIGFQSGKNEMYTLFLKRYQIENYFPLNKRMKLTFESRDLTPIDTIFFKPLNLIDTTRKYEIDAEMRSLSLYDCRLMSIFHFPKFDCIITNSNTINADSGYPILVISTFDKKGSFLSRIIYEYQWQNDYTPEPQQYFTMDNKMEIKLELYEKNFEIVDSSGIQVRKYVNTTYKLEKFSIDDKGMFERK